METLWNEFKAISKSELHIKCIQKKKSRKNEYQSLFRRRIFSIFSKLRSKLAKFSNHLILWNITGFHDQIKKILFVNLSIFFRNDNSIHHLIIILFKKRQKTPIFLNVMCSVLIVMLGIVWVKEKEIKEKLW